MKKVISAVFVFSFQVKCVKEDFPFVVDGDPFLNMDFDGGKKREQSASQFRPLQMDEGRDSAFHSAYVQFSMLLF